MHCSVVLTDLTGLTVSVCVLVERCRWLAPACPLPRPVNTNTGYWPGQPLCVTTTTTISTHTTRTDRVRSSTPWTWVMVGLMVRLVVRGVRCVGDVGSPGPVLRAQTWPGGVRPGSTHRHQSMLQSVVSDGPRYTNSHLVSYWFYIPPIASITQNNSSGQKIIQTSSKHLSRVASRWREFTVTLFINDSFSILFLSKTLTKRILLFLLKTYKRSSLSKACFFMKSFMNDCIIDVYSIKYLYLDLWI